VGLCKPGGFRVDGWGGVGMESVADLSMMRSSMGPEIAGASLRLFIPRRQVKGTVGYQQ